MVAVPLLALRAPRSSSEIVSGCADDDEEAWRSSRVGCREGCPGGGQGAAPAGAPAGAVGTIEPVAAPLVDAVNAVRRSRVAGLRTWRVLLLLLGGGLSFTG